MGKLGPHQDIELELMLMGVKPAAMITYPQRWEDFIPFVDAGLFVSRPIEVLYGNTGMLFGLQGEMKRLDRISDIYDNIRQRIPIDMYDEDHIEIGKLLGYSDEDIQTFINYDGMPTNKSLVLLP